MSKLRSQNSRDFFLSSVNTGDVFDPVKPKSFCDCTRWKRYDISVLRITTTAKNWNGNTKIIILYFTTYYTKRPDTTPAARRARYCDRVGIHNLFTIITITPTSESSTGQNQRMAKRNDCSAASKIFNRVATYLFKFLLLILESLKLC